MADKSTPENCPKPTIAEVLARNNNPEQCPLYDEHIFEEPYLDFIRDDIDKRHEERIKVMEQKLKEEGIRLEGVVRNKLEQLKKAGEKGKGKGMGKEKEKEKEGENQKENGPSSEGGGSKNRNLEILVDTQLEGYRDFVNMFNDMVNVAPPGVEVDQPGIYRRLRHVRESARAGEDVLEFLTKHIPK